MVYDLFRDFYDYLKRLRRGSMQLEPYDSAKFGELVKFREPDGYTEVERYWVNEPFAFVSILYSEEKKEHIYYTVEPELTLFERTVLETVHENILDMLSLEDATSGVPREHVLEEKTIKLLDGYSIDIEMPSVHKVLYYVKRNYTGFERIDPMMRDPDIEDVSCDGVGVPIFLYHRKYQNIKTNVTFEEKRLDQFIIKLSQKCGKHVSIGEPLVNAALPDGSRLNATLGREVTFRGGSFTIRKFRQSAFTPVDLVEYGTASPEMLAFLWLAVENGKSMIFAGATAAGKTSSMNAVSLFIPPMAKIVSIEDTQELRLHHLNWIGSVTRESFVKASVRDIDMYELLRQALRQRPEYIIVGEIRGKEALTLFQAMNTGHTTYSTMHADSVYAVVNRLEGEPINIPRVMMRALDLLCIQVLVHVNGRRVRRMESIVEFTGIDPSSNDLMFNDLFKWDPASDKFRKSGKSFVLSEIMNKRGWSEKQLNTELKNRQRIIEHLVNTNIKDEADVVLMIQSYYVDPDKVISEIG